jgi:hypothetical protein
MKIIFTCVLDDEGWPEGPQSDTAMTNYLNQALTLGDKHQDYILYVRSIDKFEPGDDE